MLRGTRNMQTPDNMLIRDGLRELQRRLPSGWSVGEPLSSMSPVEAVADVTAPDRRRGRLSLEARTHLDPKGVLQLAEAALNVEPRDSLLVIARYLSVATRAGLQERDISYVDLTGNTRVVMREPGLFIETQGATEDPNRKERPSRSLRGAKAGRIVRALIDRKQPPGVRELAVMTKIDAGYVSRVVALLDSEALITRVGRGRMQSVDWSALLRRWAREAPLEARGKIGTYLEPRALLDCVARLANSTEKYAITGSLAAAKLAPVAPTRLATIWIRDAAQAAARLALRPADLGANVLLIEPGDDGVFEGAMQREGVWYAAPSQVAADLLTSPGRGPAEGKELLNWMLANEEAWRT
jgi:hypothetical protein